MAYKIDNYKILGFYSSCFSLPGLYVAIESSPGYFKAYGENKCISIGNNFSNDVLEVAKYGMKLTKERAAIIFSDIAKTHKYEG